MANGQRGFVEVELDKTRHFRFTLNSLEEIENRIGYKLHELEGVELSISQIKVIMWAGLIHEDKTLTLDEVGEMIDLDNLPYVQDKLKEAFEKVNRKN